jgi:uncharacterized protein (TIGR04255 family)
MFGRFLAHGRPKLIKKKYRQDPIVEAVFELRLGQDKALDMTVPGLFFEKIASDFPIKEQRQIQEIEIIGGPKGVERETRNIERIFFFTEDKLQFIQIGSNLFAVHGIKPYPTWPVFRERIEKGLSTLKSITEIGIPERLGLRYINRIEIPSSRIDLDEYFEFAPRLGKKLPQELIGLHQMVMIQPKDSRDQCRMQLFSTLPETPGNSAYILDLDYYWLKPKEMEFEQILLWVEEAHTEVKKLFEGCVTSKLIKVFGIWDENG